MATMVNMNNLLNGKDSRWLQLEVCREFQRNKCSRPDTECKFAHPPANVEVQNGRVTACYDSIKGRCNREKPPCKYFHPPQHLKDQLLINGRNHLALKNALMQQMGIAPGQPVIPGQVQTVDVQNGNTSVSPIGLSLQFGSQPIMATNPYLTGMPTSTYSHYFAPGHLMPTILGPDPSTVSPLGPVVPQAVPVAQQKIPRSDRLETAPVVSAASGQILSTSAAAAAANLPPAHAAAAPLAATLGHPLEVGKKRAAENDAMFQLMDVKSVGSFYYDNFAFPGMVPYKRPAADKSGIPVYQPGATTYQQLMQLQQPFVPVSCEYPSPSPAATSTIPHTSTANPIAIVNSNTNISHFNPTTNSSNSVDVNCNSNTSSVSCSSSISSQISSIASATEATAPVSIAELKADATAELDVRAVPTPATTHSAIVLPQTITANPIPYHAASATSASPLYPNPAAIAKEVAQKNYANALKMAAASHALKPPLAALNYTGVALNKSTAGLLPTQQHVNPAAAAAAAAAAAHAAKNNALARLKTPFSVAPPPVGHSAASTMFPTLARPPPPMIVQAPHLLRPQLAAGMAPQHPYMAAAAQHNQQLLQQGIYYPGFPGSGYHLTSPVPAAVPPNMHGTGLGSLQALQAVQQAAAAQQTATPGSAVVLNPYKKMKTS
ncbi:mucin-5AC isoform X5 [Lutzomyia longipalpis]|uniref:mucin-5AC isoform X5 n=1 Tax=Lutzomyia longipalpis TaxID=7200 RepID=UPI002483E71E|nr:mucin-5AC isoform X5 [Lutzomyia longipalpis]XP_055691491.1 mucin-5AC isoform X5 [Lutzomyia longipalpis]